MVHLSVSGCLCVWRVSHTVTLSSVQPQSVGELQGVGKFQIRLCFCQVGWGIKTNSAMKSLFSVHLNLWVESETHFRNFHRDLTFDGVRMAAF